MNTTIMTTEQKAKKYDEALEWMRKLYPGLHGATKEDAEHYFPELKESDDEKIRKELIELISCMHDADPRKKRWIAYLEKQKELPFVKDVVLGSPGLYFYDGERMYFRGEEVKQEGQKPSPPFDELTPEEKMNHPLYLEGFDIGRAVQKVFDAQEQPDFPTTDEQVKEFLATHPKIKVPEKYKNPDWLFKKQEQSEVDLEKELQMFLCNYDYEFDDDAPACDIAKHFYELGLKAKEE